ncbi:MAG: GTPase Era [Treponema sp.]|jgi:GTP-binding protein Era|nr:GTPase Era [Treponema sp.]
MEKKAAFAALVGRPSTGKSTLVNRLCGESVAVVSPVPQTTRNAIRGIVNREQGQLVLVDTPGIHRSEKKFNRRLADTAFHAAVESDLILYVLDVSRAPGPEEETIAQTIRGYQTPIVAVLNKMDLPSADFGQTKDFLKSQFAVFDESCFNESRIVPISAQKNEGLENLLSVLFNLAPAGDPFYPEEYYTDQEMDFRIAEIIRGAALPFLRQELPHAVYVEVADRELRENGGIQRLWVRAFIMCERESQKGMIVGKGGTVIKAIGLSARKELNRIFDWKVDLDLRVKTGKDWRHNDHVLKKLLDK